MNTACGSRVVLARAWPAPKLPEDVVALSKRVDIDGASAGGSVLGVAKRDDDDDDDDEDVDGFTASERACVTLNSGRWRRRSAGRRRCGSNAGCARRAANSACSAARGVLEALAKRALDGRGVMVGNIVRLPLLGTSALFEVTSIEPRDAFGDGRGAEISSRTRASSCARETSRGSEDERRRVCLRFRFRFLGFRRRREIGGETRVSRGVVPTRIV